MNENLLNAAENLKKVLNLFIVSSNRKLKGEQSYRVNALAINFDLGKFSLSLEKNGIEVVLIADGKIRLVDLVNLDSKSRNYFTKRISRLVKTLPLYFDRLCLRQMESKESKEYINFLKRLKVLGGGQCRFILEQTDKVCIELFGNRLLVSTSSAEYEISIEREISRVKQGLPHNALVNDFYKKWNKGEIK